jgi:hypothetical protein
MSEPTIRNLDSLPEMFSCKELANFLGVSTFTAREIMHRPGFPIFIAGPRRHRIYKSLFIEWIEKEAKSGLTEGR